MSIGEFDDFSRCSDCGFEPYACECYGPECGWCGSRNDEYSTVGEKKDIICEDCMDDVTAKCVACGELEMKEDMVTQENTAGQTLHFCNHVCVRDYGHHQMVRDYQ